MEHYPVRSHSAPIRQGDHGPQFTRSLRRWFSFHCVFALIIMALGCLPVSARTIGMQRAPAPSVGMRSRLALPGVAGRTHRVECTGDLTVNPIQRQTLGTATVDGAGEVQFVDPAPLPLRRFYRAVEQ